MIWLTNRLVTNTAPTSNWFATSWCQQLTAGYSKVRSLIHRVKCDYSVQRIARNHKLLDFLHLSRNRYLYLRGRASKVGMLHWTWWLLTLALQCKLYRALQPKLYATRNLCMHDFLKLHHNWDAYMGVQKEPKSTFLTAFEQREKEARSLFVLTTQFQ